MLDFLAKVTFAFVLLCSFPGGTKATWAEEFRDLHPKHYLIQHAYHGNAFVCLTKDAMDFYVEAEITDIPRRPVAAKRLTQAGLCGQLPNVVWRVKSVHASYTDIEGTDTTVIVIEVRVGETPSGDTRWREGWSLLVGRVDWGDPL